MQSICIEKYLYFRDQPKYRTDLKITDHEFLERLETFYEFHFFALLNFGCRRIKCEVMRQETREAGRHDVRVSIPNQGSTIFELKANLRRKIKDEEAINATVQAIKYARPYLKKNHFVTCIGLVFNYYSKNIENWIDLKYDGEGRRKEFFSQGAFHKENVISDDLLFNEEDHE